MVIYIANWVLFKKYIFQFGLLAILCILSFLIAKYIVRNDIDGEKMPIDTSERI